MSDKAIQNAEARKKLLIDRRLALNAEIVEIDNQIGDIDNFVRVWHLFANTDTGDISASTTNPEQNKPENAESHSARTMGNSRKEDVAEAAREILRERGQPLSRSDLYDALIARGLNISGKDPHGVLTTMMWRMQNRIAKTPDGRYWLAETPHVDSGDVPPQVNDADHLRDKFPGRE